MLKVHEVIIQKKNNWHISFPEDQLIARLKQFKDHKYWHLTICIETTDAQGMKVYNWERL